MLALLPPSATLPDSFERRRITVPVSGDLAQWGPDPRGHDNHMGHFPADHRPDLADRDVCAVSGAGPAGQAYAA